MKEIEIRTIHGPINARDPTRATRLVGLEIIKIIITAPVCFTQDMRFGSLGQHRRWDTLYSGRVFLCHRAAIRFRPGVFFIATRVTTQ